MVSTRDALNCIPEYQAGRQSTPEAAIESGVVQLSSNESPWPPEDDLLEALTQASTLLNRYPSMASETLRQMLAKRHNTPYESVVVGCGGVEIGRQAAMAVLEAGDEVVFGHPSFQEFEILARLHGAEPVAVNLRDFVHDLDAMRDAVTQRTRMLIVCNPNNPTGTGIPTSVLEAFLRDLPPDCLLMVDEAYWEYAAGDLGPSAITLVPRFDNLVVLRTFSKAFGIAGARVGYGVASTALASAMRKTQLPFSVSLLAQALAIAALKSEHETVAKVRTIRAARDSMRATLMDQSLTVPQSHGNFLFIAGEIGLRLADACERDGVAVRKIGNAGVRVTLGNTAENARFLIAVRALLDSERAVSEDAHP